MLWRCCPFLVLRRSICDPRASGPLAGPKFQPPNKTRQHRRGLGTTDPVRQLWRDPKMVLQQSPIQPDRGSVALRRKTSDWPPQIHLWNVCDVTQESHLLHFPTSALPSAGQMWYYRGSFWLIPSSDSRGQHASVSGEPPAGRASKLKQTQTQKPHSSGEWRPVKKTIILSNLLTFFWDMLYISEHSSNCSEISGGVYIVCIQPPGKDR